MSSHAHAPSQNPATRMIGAEGVGQPYRPAPTRLPARLRLSSLRQQIRQQARASKPVTQLVELLDRCRPSAAGSADRDEGEAIVAVPASE
jgi:hypothetical protein